MTNENVPEPLKTLTFVGIRFANEKILSLQLNLNDAFCGKYSTIPK